MKKILMKISAIILGLFGLILLSDNNKFWGVLLIIIAVMIIITAFTPTDKKGKLMFYNPNASVNKLVINSAFQMFESLLIINQTKNMKTLKNRVEYIQGRYLYFINQSNEETYLQNIENSVILFRQKYGKQINEKQISLFKQPNQEALNEYIGSCIVLNFGEYVKEETNIISTLIRENVIRNRKIKIIETGNAYKLLLSQLNINDDRFYNTIEEIQKEFKL